MMLGVVITEDNAIDYLVHAFYVLGSELDSLEYFVKRHDSRAMPFFENCEYYSEAAKKSLKIIEDNGVKFPEYYVAYFNASDEKIGVLRDEWASQDNRN